MIGSFQLAVFSWQLAIFSKQLMKVIAKKMPNDDIHSALLYHLIGLCTQN